ncbi:MAG: hemerythrin domain-containing protein [Zoogloeaceae bacterium]|jgi:hemerythrin-like metal-binding protein|nr:hemerythrin domain-containing protein [Zoogloeaceae bacterium]
MEWKAQYQLKHPPMDEMHQEFVKCVTALSNADDAAANTVLAALIAHSERHFAQENRWMEESGFPPAPCHTEEHSRVLTSLKEILALSTRGDPGLGRVVAGEMERWFEQHAATMDTALAIHMRRAGYVPTAD